jgi:hypothetical protein
MHWFGPVGPPAALTGIIAGRCQRPGHYMRCAACNQRFGAHATGVRVVNKEQKVTRFLHLECSVTRLQVVSGPVCTRRAGAMSYAAHLEACDACATAQRAEDMCSSGLVLTVFMLQTLPTGAVLQNTGAE